MSTTTTTQASSSRATPARSSLASSIRLRAFTVAMAITSPVMYVICVLLNLPLFTFHPATNRFAWGWEAARSGEGPAMYWYGWVATVLIVGLIIGIVATMLPASVTRKIPLALVWLLPMLAIPIMAYTLMPFWTHP
ncbi:MAG: hypothetical protein ACXU9A_08025 [Xanthobacteraceae bacterium]